MIRKLSTDETWQSLLYTIMMQGAQVAPRKKTTLELIGQQTNIPMAAPVVTIRSRKLGYRFLFAEALWILTGDNRVETIAPYSKHISNFSDDGRYFNGAYGPKVVDQLSYVVNQLVCHDQSRQAVMNIWRERPGPSKDIPCTISAQWLIRQKKIHCVVTMRSSDAWLGWPYDVFNFSIISCYILLLMRREWDTNIHLSSLNTVNPHLVSLGDLTLTAGSQHLYEENFQKAQVSAGMRPSEPSGGNFAYGILDANDYSSPEDFLTHLRQLRDRDWGKIQHKFMSGLKEELDA
jgi:thymidylate synthase